MELKKHLIEAYAYLFKKNEIDLEPVEESEKKFVPEEYRDAVANYSIAETKTKAP